MPELRGRVERAIGRVLEASIRAWVQDLGREVLPSEEWLQGPVGTHTGIGRSALRENTFFGLSVREERDEGLLDDFRALRGREFDPDQVDPRVREFYEHTARYVLQAEPIWSPLFLPLGRTMIHLVSRNIDQLNIPISQQEAGQGMTSEIFSLRRHDGSRAFTAWLRRLPTGETVYAGFYSIGRPPNFRDPCIRVLFPLPKGNVTVFLRPEVLADGSFRLVSSGRRYGDPGFYRVVAVDGHTRARYVAAFQETFHLYLAGDALITDHVFRFHSLEMFRLHYRIVRRGSNGFS